MVHIHDCPDVEIFDGSQGHGNSAFVQRVQEHPDGFVAWAYKPYGADMTVLHRASCKEMNTPDQYNYTQGMYFMAFSSSLRALSACAETWQGKVERCMECHPFVTEGKE